MDENFVEFHGLDHRFENVDGQLCNIFSRGEIEENFVDDV